VSAAAELPLAEFDVVGPALIERHGYPHELWTRRPIHCELA
jgi:hypothetical protein